MGKKKKSILPKIEVLIILVFFASFIFWAASKCNATKLLYEEQESATSNVTEEATNDEKSEATQNTPISQEEAVPNPTKPNDISTTNQNTSISNRKRYSRLYVTIDGLNLRKEPSL
ncbi:MAG TPA: hypothetical protein ENK52_01335, partial [Saprospiraceae bacterium]|nr:hypothetical protein [Saprospiraceae bacterium]